MTCRPASAAVDSTAAISSSQSSAATSGGRKTCSRPPRGSTARRGADHLRRLLAGRGQAAARRPARSSTLRRLPGAAQHRLARAGARAARTDRARSRARCARDRPRAGCPAAGAGRSGCRRGPGTACRRGRTSGRSATAGAPFAAARRSGSTQPTGAARPCANTRAMRARSSGSRRRLSSATHVRRQPMLAPQVVMHVLMRRQHHRRIDLQPLRQRRGEARRLLRPGGVAVAVGVGEQAGIAPDRLAIRPPVRRQRPAGQRLARILLAHGRDAAPPPAPRAAPAGAAARRHSGAWSGRARRCSIPARPGRWRRRRSAPRPWSGARRPRPARDRPAPRPPGCPATPARCTAWSRAGFPTRAGPTWRRRSSTSHGSTRPEIGAADCGSGLAASGMWPSPASRPEVASSPIQPAPGR